MSGLLNLTIINGYPLNWLVGILIGRRNLCVFRSSAPNRPILYRRPLTTYAVKNSRNVSVFHQVALLRFGNEKLNLDFVLGKRRKGAAVSLSCGRLSIFFQAERNLGDRTIFHDLMGSSSACCSCRVWMNVNCGTTVKKTFFYLSQVAEENLFRRTRIWITNGTHSRPTQNANIITNRACHYYNWNPFSVRDAFLYQSVVMNNMKFITPPHSLYHTLR